MEDGIEQNRTTLYDRLEIEKKMLYVYVPNEKNDYNPKLFTHNKEVAVKFARHNNCKVEIFICYLEDNYVTTNSFIHPQ